MNYSEYPDAARWNELLRRPVNDPEALESLVWPIMQDVKARGDEALALYSKKFDGTLPQVFSAADQAEMIKEIPAALREAIDTAARNIRVFHEAQREKVTVIETTPGVRCYRKSVAIERVGLYIPGGTAPLFSTVLMLGIPAQLAGCKEIVLCTPPAAGGTIHPAIAYAAQVCGINRIFGLGGVQAIAAMAYGTKTIPQVYKIFGPGNQYVTAAKQLLMKEGIAIDMPAGPSELAVYADETAVPAFVAADLLSQAEHGADSQTILVSASEKVLKAVIGELDRQLELLPRKDIAGKALENSRAILVKDETTAMDLLNAYAPEHLILACGNAAALAEKVVNAGSVFLGNWSPESAGDYASGTNHTLPTSGFARAFSGVSLDSFVKKITFQEISQEGLKNIGNAVEIMADAEGLQAHRNAVTIRLQYNP
ncbi:MAG: histidinol dehydrogenase [Bacteroidetes bacterium]|nr:MAG: histidinol dehydrogenase [Bacteroidota bacterium]